MHIKRHIPLVLYSTNGCILFFDYNFFWEGTTTMQNKLTDLQNHLFSLMEKLNDDDLIGDDLETEIRRSEAFSHLAIIAVKNGALMAKCAEVYGLPVSGDLPLLPASPGAIAPKAPEKNGKNKSLLKNRGGDDDE